MDGPGHPSLVQGADDVCRDDVTLAEQDAAERVNNNETAGLRD